MLRRLAASLVVCCAFVVAPGSMAAVSTFPGEQRVTGPEVVASVDAALAYWASQGQAIACPSGVETWVADLPPGDALHPAAKAVLGGCKVWLDDAWVRGLTDAIVLCEVMTHEVGHLAGLPDGGTGNAVMDGPTAEQLPATPHCLAAFPPPAPPSPPAVAVAVEPPPVVTPARPEPLTVARLRTAAGRLLRSAGMRRVRPVACRVSGRQRGWCRVASPGKRCPGRVLVTTSASGVTGVVDARCARVTGRAP